MRALILFIAMSSAMASTAPHAQALEDGPDTRGVIQNRKYRLGHELTLTAGTLPIDPFFKGVTAGLSYTFHINDFHAVEVGGLGSYNIDSYLTQQLLDLFGVSRASLPGLQALVYVNYVLKQFYGKFALANRTLLYEEVFFDVGVQATYWSDATIRVGPDFGGGVRFFVFPWLSLRGDIRHAVVFNKVPFLDKAATVDGVLYLGTGASLSFGG